MEAFPKRHKDLYQDTMVESSSYRNPPERCPRPLCSWNSTQEGHNYAQSDQSENLKDYNIVVKEEYKEEDEEYGVMEEFSEGHKDMMETPNYQEPTREMSPSSVFPGFHTGRSHYPPPSSEWKPRG
ncbi:uncharacterized protein LOC143956047 [Lithobates pipiens]